MVEHMEGLSAIADLADLIIVHPVELEINYEPMPIDWHMELFSTTDAQDLVLAQFEQDLWGDVSGAFNNFVESGQLWALLIGIVLGYLLKGLTSFG
ncbi:MAG: hypothetical protein ACTS2F_27900 [Thainema sp.]